ncbi:MAG: toll/interleukin-1 receptor domain-containing protein [Gammaproteobacteria bacterium]
MNRIFLSYSRKDDALLGEFVRQLYAAQQAKTIDYWYDRDRVEGIQPGERFPDALKAEIQNANVFCIFLTSYWTNSPWCLDELQCAVAAGKPIVPIQVLKVFPPPGVELNSRLPNDEKWIGSLDPAKRNDVWYDVVAALAKMDSARARTAGTAAPRSPQFERLVRRLARCKQLHDLEHKLLEGGVLPLEIQATDLSGQTVTPESGNGVKLKRTLRFASVVDTMIRGTAAQLRAVKTSSGTLLEETDTADVETVLKYLDGATVVRKDIDGLVNEISGLRSILQHSLTHFGNQIEKLAPAFDPIRYVQSLRTPQPDKRMDSVLDEEWAKTVAARHYRKLAEHVLLQDVYDRLNRNIPDVTEFSKFRTDWRYIRSIVSGFVDTWRATDPVDDASEDVREKRRAAARSFDKLDALRRTFADATAGDWDNDVCTAVNEFVRNFGAYFLEVDAALKSEYEAIEAKLDSTHA